MTSDSTSAPEAPSLNSGIALAELDPDVRPQDDLFRHVNAKWIARTEIPADKARYGSFLVLAEQAELAVRSIVEEAQSAEAGSEARKIGDLYASFMAEEQIDASGAEPLRELLALAATPRSIADLMTVMGRLGRGGVTGAINLFVDNDPGDPDRYLVFVEQGGLGLPDESYYREDRFAEIRTRYQDHVERMLQLVASALPDGAKSAASRAGRIVALEHEIAAVHWDNVATRDAQRTYNLTGWEAFCELAAGVPLAGWREGIGIPAEKVAEVVVREPSFVSGLAALLSEDRLESWLDWLAWQVVRSNAPYLSGEIVQANFDFYGTALTGTPNLRARWKRGVGLVEGALGEAIGKIYVERHFPMASKSAMDQLVTDLVEAYRRSIQELPWMSAQTRQRALEKLSKFTPKIGYPVRWRDYSTLQISAENLIANVRAVDEFEFQRELGKVGAPVDRDEWFMTPQTINAYYNPGFNEIVFPAAILQYPFFDPEREAAANYGAIGAVIGHEIGHGFDDQGSQYDGDGRLANWWTDADRSAFEERTGALIGQYDVLAPTQTPEHNVNGSLTIGENIGDLGGLSIAWRAYLIHLEREGLTVGPELDGLSAVQRFFLSWAQAWQQKSRDEEVIRLLAIDPHSPNEFRCNQIVRNIDEFYEAFDVQPADRLWLAAADRVSIW